MVTIMITFALLTGFIITLTQARQNSTTVKSIGFFFLGITVLLLAAPYFEKGDENYPFLPYLLLAILAIHFFLSLILMRKTQLYWSIIPAIASGFLLFIPDIQTVAYMGFFFENGIDLVIIAILAALTPVLTHLLKLLISYLILRFGNIKWADNEDNYLETMVAFSFVGGIAALGNFLLGPVGLIIAAVFYLSSSLISQNKLGLKNDIMLAAAGALFLLIFTNIYLHDTSFDSLNFLRAEVLEGAFLGGFIIIFYDLMLRLARFNQGKTKQVLVLLALLVPTGVLLALGGGYLMFERLGGILTLSAVLITMALLSIIFALFKNSSFVGLQLLSLGIILVITPYIRPIEQERGINLEELGLETTESGTTNPSISHTDALGLWKIDEEEAKIFFELGPSDGRTKGEFKTLSGTIELQEEITSSQLAISIPVKELTTYISPRDKELMGDGYFNEEKFPTITYKAKLIAKKDDFYLSKGDFTMMGVTKEIEVKLQLVGIAEKEGKRTLIITGEAQLDRTEFGMSPSSKIGNIVDFEFEIKLNQ